MLCGVGCAGYVVLVAQAMWWVAGLSDNKTKPASWGLAELGKNQIKSYAIRNNPSMSQTILLNRLYNLKNV